MTEISDNDRAVIIGCIKNGATDEWIVAKGGYNLFIVEMVREQYEKVNGKPKSVK